MSKLTNFIDTIAQFPTRFFVGGVSTTIEQNWGIQQIGTKNKAEYFNEIQKNNLINTNAIKSFISGGELYTTDLEGYDDFGAFDINLLVNFSETNTGSNLVLKIGAIDYPMKFLLKGSLVDLPLRSIEGVLMVSVRNNIAIVDLQPTNELITSISGLPYDGFVQDPIPKVINRTYRDKNTGYILKCIKSGNVTVPSTEYFASFSNNDLLKRIDNVQEEYFPFLASTNSLDLNNLQDIYKKAIMIFVVVSGAASIPINSPSTWLEAQVIHFNYGRMTQFYATSSGLLYMRTQSGNLWVNNWKLIG